MESVRLYASMPISLKRKKPDQLIEELKKKSIQKIFDVRRVINPFNSAKYYYEAPFEKLLAENGIKYQRVTGLANDKYAKSLKEYIDKEKFPYISDIYLNHLESINGFVCYCTEEAQANDECHASWICTVLTILEINSIKTIRA